MTDREARDLEDLNSAFRDVYATAAGKRVIFWLLGECGLYDEAFRPGADEWTHYRLGQQAFGRKLLAKLDELDPRYYPQLLLDVAEMTAVDCAAAERPASTED